MIDNSKKFEEYRNKYNTFRFNNYEINKNINSLDFKFYYEIDNLDSFVTSWSIDIINKNVNIDEDRLNKLVFSLGLVELISYWKMVCSNNIIIESGGLSIDEINWWKKLYINGLGEFFYTSSINYNEKLMNITATKDIIELKENHIDNKKVLIPIGGGKDSITTIELLKNKFDSYCYIINSRKATKDTFETSNIDKNKLIEAKRVLDKKILEYNEKGYLNGHTPFSAIVAFSSVIACLVNDIKYVALSNESSANEPTILNTNINHQYSKSFEFENDFRNYEKKYIKTDVDYFSFLRPLTESGIAYLFSKLKKYHSIFRSCNVGSKTDIWCGHCSKCLFVYIILSPFMESDELIKIFGKDLLDDIELVDIFDKLVGQVENKPFECVGSRKEVEASVKYTINKYLKKNKKLPKLLSYYLDNNKIDETDSFDLYKCLDDNNNLPKEFYKVIKENIND